MFKAATRKQTQTTFKPCLEVLEQREQLSSFSVGSVASTVLAEVSAIPTRISQMEQSFLSSLQTPQFHIAADATLVAIGSSMISAGKTLPPPEGALLSFTGYSIESIAADDFLQNVLHYQGPSLLTLAFGVAPSTGPSSPPSPSPGPSLTTPTVTQGEWTDTISYPGSTLSLTIDSSSGAVLITGPASPLTGSGTMQAPSLVTPDNGANTSFSADVTGNFKGPNGENLSTIQMSFVYPDNYPTKPADVAFFDPQDNQLAEFFWVKRA